ncbi:MAG: hypothetical protein LBU58_03160, partial [Clostridiales bacterium]|nr:hypothetical protein [Clostridiales bacterium]
MIYISSAASAAVKHDAEREVKCKAKSGRKTVKRLTAFAFAAVFALLSFPALPAPRPGSSPIASDPFLSFLPPAAAFASSEPSQPATDPAVTPPPAGEIVSDSGLIFRDYTAYARNSTRVLTDIFPDDAFRLEVRFDKPDSITLAGDVGAKVMGGSFTGSVVSATYDSGQKLVTVTLDLTLTGRTATLMLNLTGSRGIGTGPMYRFDDPRSLTVRECHPEAQDENAGVINPSAPSEPPRFAVDLSAKFPVAKAGETYVFEIPVKNIGKQAAKDITVTLDPGGDTSAAFPFEYDKYAFTARIAEIAVNGVRSARFEVRVLPTAKDGQNSINVKFSGRSVLGVGALAESAETIAIKVTNTNTAPKLLVERIDLGADTIKPGASFSMKLRLENSGTLAAKNVKLTLKGLKADGISTDNSPDVHYLNEVKGRAGVTETFLLVSSEKLTGERAELSLAMSYTDETAKEYTDESVLFIPLTQEAQGSTYTAVEFANMSAPTGELREGDNFTVSFEIKNIGDVPMRDVKLTYTIGAELIGRSLSTQMLKPIAPQGGVPVSFDFGVSKSVATGNFPIGFTVEYTPGKPGSDAETGADAGSSGGGSGTGSGSDTGSSDGAGTGQRVTAAQYVGVQLFKPEETTTDPADSKESVPKIIISNYDYEPPEAKAGQTVDITLTFFNTSAAQTVKNIKIQLDSETAGSSGGSTSGSSSAGVFSPVEGSNTFYIEQIPPRETAEKSIRLMIRGDAEAKSYPLYSNIEYEDSKSNAITARESISIPVTQVTKITIGDITLNTAEIFPEQPFGVTFNFINMGKTTLYNVMVTTDGPFTTQAQSYYAGNLQSGAQDYFDGQVTPEFADISQTGYALITYEDAAGKQYEERREFQFDVMEPPSWGEGEGMPEGGMAEAPPVEGPGGSLGFFTGIWTKVKEPAVGIPAAAGLGVALIVV